MSEPVVGFKLLHPEPLLVGHFRSFRGGEGRRSARVEAQAHRPALRNHRHQPTQTRGRGGKGGSTSSSPARSLSAALPPGSSLNTPMFTRITRATCVSSDRCPRFWPGCHPARGLPGCADLPQASPRRSSIFLVPENSEDWFNRLKNRGTETEESLRIRLGTIGEELKIGGFFRLRRL